MTGRIIGVETIRVGLCARDSEDVIRQLAQLLYEAGYVNDRYESAVLERERKSPTGLAFEGMGVAIPHADQQHVRRTGVAVAVLRKQAQFGEMGAPDRKVNVKLVIMLAVHDPGAVVPMLQSVVLMLQDERALKGLGAARSRREVLEILQGKLWGNGRAEESTPEEQAAITKTRWG